MHFEITPCHINTSHISVLQLKKIVIVGEKCYYGVTLAFLELKPDNLISWDGSIPNQHLLSPQLAVRLSRSTPVYPSPSVQFNRPDIPSLSHPQGLTNFFPPTK